MQILVWTPVGSAMVSERRILIDRYLAAIDGERNISTGHTALELPGQLYISHYPLADIDRDFGNFRAVLRGGENMTLRAASSRRCSRKSMTGASRTDGSRCATIMPRRCVITGRFTARTPAIT